MTPSGAFTFTPVTDYNGTIPAINYTISDGALSDEGDLTIIITPVNDPPVAVDDTFTTTEDTPFTADVLGNDTDSDLNTILSITQFAISGTTYNAGASATLPGIGTVLLSSTGDLTFTPALNFNGLVPDITYTISDGNGGTDEGLIHISVTPVNDPPLAADDSYAGPEELVVSGNVLNNDSDIDGDALTVIGFSFDGQAAVFDPALGGTVTLAGVGTLVMTPSGAFTFTPVINYNGTVPVITYTLSDGLLTDIANVSIFLTGINDVPLVTDDSITTPEDTPVSGNVLSNDSDPDFNLLTVTQFTINGVTYNSGFMANVPGVGTIVVNADGAYAFTPALNYNGTVPEITYEVNDGNGGVDTALIHITVIPVNDVPFLANDLVSTLEEMPVSGNVLTNDADPDGDSVVVWGFVVSDFVYQIYGASGPTAILPGVGSIQMYGNGSFTFTPATNYNGTVPNIRYIAHDGLVLRDAYLSIIVVPVNDPPVAVNDTYMATEDTPFTANVLTNDTDPDLNTSLIVTQFTINSITYNAGVTASIPGVGTVVVSPNGNLNFVPALNFNGSVPDITYTISDGSGGTDEGLIEISVTAVNDAPTATDDIYTTLEDVAVSGNVLTNDSDLEGTVLSITGFAVNGTSIPVNSSANGVTTIAGIGVFELSANGTFTFTPYLDYVGTVPSIVYTVTDGNLTDVATLNIFVEPVNDAPIAESKVTSIDEDTQASGNVLVGVSDTQ